MYYIFSIFCDWNSLKKNWLFIYIFKIYSNNVCKSWIKYKSYYNLTICFCQLFFIWPLLPMLMLTSKFGLKTFWLFLPHVQLHVIESTVTKLFPANKSVSQPPLLLIPPLNVCWIVLSSTKEPNQKKIYGLGWELFSLTVISISVFVFSWY